MTTERFTAIAKMKDDIGILEMKIGVIKHGSPDITLEPKLVFEHLSIDQWNDCKENALRNAEAKLRELKTAWELS